VTVATRRERVVLELEDNFTTGMARAAASTALLNRELGSLSRDSVRTRSSVSDIDRPIQGLGRSSNSTSREVDKLSGRMRILADVAAVLGPSLVPVGAVGVPAVTGLAAQLGFAATAGATAILAFQGIGNTLKTLNAAALNPTKENLEKAQIALEGLSPEAQKFVAQIGHMIPELKRLRDVAAGGLFPGATEGLAAMETALPHVQNVIAAVSQELGNIARDAGVSLASEKWTDFLDFVAREAPPALADMARAAGNTAHAVASLWMSTDPLNDDFSRWLVNATADVDRWATSLSKTQGFADFIAYVETTGPKVASALGAIANAAIQIVQAAAPLGGPVLQGIKALADVVAAIADSDLGTPLFTAAAGLALFNRTMGLSRAIGRTTFGGMVADELRASAGIRTLIADLRVLQRQTGLVTLPGKNFVGPLTEAQVAAARLKQTLPAVAKTSALIGGLAVASTGAADKIGLTNTASLALMGTLAGPWGAAVGGAVGLLLDAKNAGQGFTDTMHAADVALKGFDTTAIETSIARLKAQKKDLQNVTGFGDFFGDLGGQLSRPKELLPGGTSSVDQVSAKIDKLKGKLEFTRGEAQARLLADGFEATSHGIDTATGSTQNFQRELEKLNAALTGRATLRDFEQSLDDFTGRQKKRAKVLADLKKAQEDLASAKTPAEKDAARQRIKDLTEQGNALKNSLDIGTQAGRDTQALLDNIAATALRFAQTLDPIARTEFLAGARTDFIKAAQAAGYTRDQAKALADEVLGLSKIKGQPKIAIDADGAWRVITETQRRINALKGKTLKLGVDYFVNQANGINRSQNGGRDDDPNTPFWSGGWTGPGAKYQPAGVVHADEFVFSKEATHGHVAELSALHDRLRGYADGGMVQRVPAPMASSLSIHSSVSLSQADIAALAQAMSAVRPMYGDAHFYGDHTQWRRQMEEDRRLASIGGVPV
jgi:hypothetical protein